MKLSVILNEAPRRAFFEGLLWSGQGVIEGQPIRNAFNALVISVIALTYRSYCDQAGQEAFVVLKFTAADQQGRCRIDVWFLSSTLALRT